MNNKKLNEKQLLEILNNISSELREEFSAEMKFEILSKYISEEEYGIEFEIIDKCVANSGNTLGDSVTIQKIMIFEKDTDNEILSAVAHDESDGECKDGTTEGDQNE